MMRLPSPTDLRHPAVLAVAAAAVLAGAVVLYRIDPAGATFYPPCAFHWLTGLHCPGCGSTRAVHQLLHGRVVEALRLSPVLFVGIGLGAYQGVSNLRERSGRRPWPRLFASAWAAWGLFALMWLFAVARNLPFEPFRRLAP